MRAMLCLTIFLLLCGVSILTAQPVDQCFTCHSTLETPQAQKYVNDIHYKKGISCAGCHGGDPLQDDMEKAMDPKKGFLGVPQGNAIVKTCLRCHADKAKMSSFRSSLDIEQFQEFPKSVHAESDIATCITCHGVHEIRSHKDPQSPVYPTREIVLCSNCHGNANYMKGFNPSLPTDQLEKYKTSVHGQKIQQGDIHVATCSDCHGIHNIYAPKDPRSSVYALNVPKTCAKCHSNPKYMKPYGLPTDQYEKFTSSVHGIALLKKQDTAAPACNDCHGNHGATPPGILSISHVCGECHALNAEYFANGPHALAFEEGGIAQCEVCHGNHEVQPPTDEMLHTGKGSVCENCHSKEEKGYQTAQQMYEMIQKLKRETDQAELLLKTAEEKGMDVSDARFKAKDIPGELIKARTVTHSADLQAFRKEIDIGFGLAQEAAQAGKSAIHEYSFRRRGLQIATLFITMLVIGLYLKIRQIETRQQAEKKPEEDK